MKTRRKPVPKPIAAAIEELHWRAKILLEFIDGLETFPNQAGDAARRLQYAIEDYEASKVAPEPVTIFDREPLLDFAKVKQ